jgi:hypothetical protein
VEEVVVEGVELAVTVFVVVLVGVFVLALVLDVEVVLGVRPLVWVTVSVAAGCDGVEVEWVESLLARA